MQTPKEKYESDAEYAHLVDMLTQLIHKTQFTPSELREACMLAYINYELRCIPSFKVPESKPEILAAIQTLNDFINNHGEQI